MFRVASGPAGVPHGEARQNVVSLASAEGYPFRMSRPEWQRASVVFLLGLLVLGPAAPAAAERGPQLEGGVVFDCELADDPDTPEIDGPTADDVWYCPYQWNLHRVNAPGAWRLGGSGSSSMTATTTFTLASPWKGGRPVRQA